MSKEGRHRHIKKAKLCWEVEASTGKREWNRPSKLGMNVSYLRKEFLVRCTNRWNFDEKLMG
ncbi:hypothetical protein DT065_06825 [Salicibibacter kimchii]|uniref:Uncharacterized protein n=1 Tax=Salicibibacter kimchii TaxID=2099786 RepID=A0A345BXT5_9BACI|nr:hypothetical protein DT065_06825 [Salicibibacter kimchii]